MADVKTTGARKPRSDAERNRAHIIGVAKTVFAEKGQAASLDEIARTAGVGPGTLYRHFPTRDALVEAVYRNETAQLTAAAANLAETQPPLGALREWLLLFVDYITTKQAMSELIHTLATAESDLKSATTAQLAQAVSSLVRSATESGDAALQLEPLDLLRALAGVAKKGGEQDGASAAKGLVDILIAGMQTRR